jgi:hypothetical protein
MKVQKDSSHLNFSGAFALVITEMISLSQLSDDWLRCERQIDSATRAASYRIGTEVRLPENEADRPVSSVEKCDRMSSRRDANVKVNFASVMTIAITQPSLQPKHLLLYGHVISCNTNVAGARRCSRFQ